MAERMVPARASLRRSILIWLVLATAAIGVLALIDTRTEAMRTARDVSDRVLVGSAMAIAEGVDADAESGIAVSIPFSALDMLSSTAQDQVFYRIDGPTGLLTGYGDLEQAPVAPGQEIGLTDARFRSLRVRTTTILRDVTTGEGTLPYRVTVAETTRARDALAQSILTRSALRIAGLIAGAALLAWAAATYALRPLDRLSRAIAARAPHDLMPIQTEAPAELWPVLDALNAFLARLARSMAALQNFASNANHQIRTPLTVARTQIALAAKRDDARSGQTLDKAEAALVRIERVLEQILLLARIEATGNRPALKLLDVAALARGITADLLPQAVKQHQDLGYEGPDSAFGFSEEVLLGELLRNLVDNALTHCPPETVVTVHVGAEQPEGLRLSVTDTAPPISDAQLALLANRLDPRGTESPRMGQHGLGLHITAEIARALQADLRLSRGHEGKGIAVTLLLPTPERM